MSRNAKIMIAVVAVGILASCCCCGGFFLWSANTGMEVAVAAGEGQRDGYSAAERMTTRECVDAGVARARECGVVEVTCSAAAEEFTITCLDNVRAPDASICADVPAPTSGNANERSRAFCNQHGLYSVACERVYFAIIRHCAPRGRRAP